MPIFHNLSVPVLDHGFVRVVETMGTDGSVVQAARVSHGLGTKTPAEDSNLINYLINNEHTSPFEMCEIKFNIKMPIFVARQWVRHRTANINEISARYSVLSNEFYIPTADQICLQSKSHKQGRGNPVQLKLAEQTRETIRLSSQTAYENYIHLIDENVARETARILLPVNIYTEWYWKIDLHNLLHFLKLRCDPKAQYEIRQYANVILEMVRSWVPVTYLAFMKKVNML